MKILLYVFLSVGVLTGIACGPDPTPTKGEKPPGVVMPPVHNSKIIEDGSWEVGSEIEIGTYETVVPMDLNGCYWARLKDSPAEIKDITENGMVQPGNIGRIVITKNDVYIEVSGGCIWRKK